MFRNDLSKAEKRTRHKIFDFLISQLENKQIKFRGQISPFILHPLTVKGLFLIGWTQCEIEDLEASIFNDAKYLRNVEILQDVSANLFRELKKIGEENQIFKNRIVGVPGKTLNALLCGELEKRFSEIELNLCDCFVKVRDFGIDGKPCEMWRIDIDESLSRAGFFIPLRDENRLIKNLRVFRYLRDSRPFTLRARFDLIDYTKGNYEEIF